MKKYTLLQLANIVDVRLFTNIDDIYDILGFVCNFKGIMTYHLPVALKYVKQCNPEWFINVENDLKNLESKDFRSFSINIQNNNKEYEINQLPAELLTDETFGKFMVENSLPK